MTPTTLSKESKKLEFTSVSGPSMIPTTLGQESKSQDFTSVSNHLTTNQQSDNKETKDFTYSSDSKTTHEFTTQQFKSTPCTMKSHSQDDANVGWTNLKENLKVLLMAVAGKYIMK